MAVNGLQSPLPAQLDLLRLSPAPSDTTSSDSPILFARSGHDALDRDVEETMQFFDCIVSERRPLTAAAAPLAVVTIKLPWYASGASARSYLYVAADIALCPAEDGSVSLSPSSLPQSSSQSSPQSQRSSSQSQQSSQSQESQSYRATYAFVSTAESKKALDDLALEVGPDQMARLWEEAAERARQWAAPPRMLSVIDAFYLVAEERRHAAKDVAVRDFCYAPFDPRHWGRLIYGHFEQQMRGAAGSDASLGRAGGSAALSIHRAAVLCDYAGGHRGGPALSLAKGEVVLVLAALGSGHLLVRKYPSSSTASPLGRSDGRASTPLSSPSPAPPLEAMMGVIPEGYVQRQS